MNHTVSGYSSKFISYNNAGTAPDQPRILKDLTRKLFDAGINISITGTKIEVECPAGYKLHPHGGLLLIQPKKGTKINAVYAGRNIPRADSPMLMHSAPNSIRFEQSNAESLKLTLSEGEFRIGYEIQFSPVKKSR